MVQFRRLGQLLTIEVWPVWLFFAGLCCAWGISYMLASGPKEHVLYSGVGLQFGGLGTVAYGIATLRKSFGKPSLKERLLVWINKVRVALGKPVSCVAVVGSGGAVASCGSIVATGTVGGRTLEDRVDALEKALAAFQKEHDQQITQVRSDVSRVEGLVQVEGTARQDGDAQLLQRLEDLAVGGIHLELVGFVWLVLGTLGTSIPEEIAKGIPDMLML